MLGIILIVITFFLLLAALPHWRHGAGWGYAPSGGLGVVLIVLLILMATGRI